jgi:Fic family protein
MERAKFLQNCPGEVVDIADGECAFVPNPLPPPDLALKQETNDALAEAMHWMGRLDGVALNLHEPGILLRPLENREAIRSSALEGTYATPRELLLFDLPDDARRPAQQVDAWREVVNYRSALTRSDGSSIVDSPMTTIRQLHTVLLQGVRGNDQTPGAFRRQQVFIGHAHRFTPSPPEHLQGCLDSLASYIRDAAPRAPRAPLIRAFLTHYQFETIHPFNDGNGRVGRLLMTLMIREFCGHKRPWLYLSAYFDRHKDEYIDRLFAVSTQGAWAEWIDFCLRATIDQASDTFDRCTRLLALRESYRQKVGNKARLALIVDQLFIRTIVQVSSLASVLEVTYPTANKDVERLEALDIVVPVPDYYPKTYYAREIYNIAFHEPELGIPSMDK